MQETNTGSGMEFDSAAESEERKGFETEEKADGAQEDSGETVNGANDGSEDAAGEAEDAAGVSEDGAKEDSDGAGEDSEDSLEGDATAEEGAEGEEGSEAASEGKKEGLFKKKKKDKRDEQIEELSDKLRRQMAEFDNFRKRTEKEKSQMFDMGARTVIEKILPVVDNFERGLAALPEEQREDAFVLGMDKVYKQLMTEFEAMGVKAIETEGKEFDPEFHNAVMQVESEELESGMIAQELQKGYQYKDTVVRHSMVSVVS